MSRVTKLATAMQPTGAPQLSKWYPRWITNSEGAQMIVQNREQHEAQVGHKVNEDGSEIDPEIMETIRSMREGNDAELALDVEATDQDPAANDPGHEGTEPTPVKRGGRPRKAE